MILFGILFKLSKALSRDLFEKSTTALPRACLLTVSDSKAICSESSYKEHALAIHSTGSL